MKNIQVIDDAINTRYAIYAVTDDEFGMIFPGDGQDVEFIEDLVVRMGDSAVYRFMAPVWDRAVAKPDVAGIHGTLFYGLPEKRKFYEDKREPPNDWCLVS